LPAIFLRLLIVFVMVLSSFSVNFQNVNADDGTPPAGDDIPTEVPTEIQEIDPVTEAQSVEPTEEATLESFG
jgi:hypothetical protein